MKLLLDEVKFLLLISQFSTLVTADYSTNQLHAIQNSFAGKLYNVISEDKDANIFYSPFSISFALSALAIGTEGQAFKELQNALSLPSDKSEILKSISVNFNDVIKGDENITVANGFFVDKRFKVEEKFLNHIKNEFSADYLEMAFSDNPEQCTIEVNKWIENKTRSLIKDLLPKGTITTDTVAVLVNAVYFKSQWIHPFDIEETKVRPFYGLNKEYQTEMMLIRRKFNYKYAENLESHIILLPYLGNYRMLLLVPNERDGIILLDAKLKQNIKEKTSQFLDSLITDVEKLRLKLIVPKCSLTVETDLKSVLQKIGIKSLFKSGGGNLEKMSNDSNLKVSGAFHKASIKIDEVSTEAAAASGFSITNRMGPTKPKTIKADHPFVFAILHKITKTIIFVGRLSHF